MIIFSMITVLFATSFAHAMQYVPLYAFAKSVQLNQKNPVCTFLPSHNALCVSDSSGSCALYSKDSDHIKTLDFPSYKHVCPSYEQFLKEWTFVDEDNNNQQDMTCHNDGHFKPIKSLYCPKQNMLFIAKNEQKCGSLTAHTLKGTHASDCAIQSSMQFQENNKQIGHIDDIALLNTQIASICSYKNNIKIWDIISNTCTNTLVLNAWDPEKITSISPDILIVAAKAIDYGDISLRLFDIRNNTSNQSYRLDNNIASVRALAPDNTEHRFLSASFFDQSIKQWDIRMNDKPSQQFNITNNLDYIYDIITYNSLVIGISEYGTIYIWDSTDTSTNPKQIETSIRSNYLNIQNDIHKATVAPDGTLFILGPKQPTLYTFNLTKKQ